MVVQNLFSSGLELANSLVNSNPLQQAWNANENHPEEASLYCVTKLPESNCTIISFKALASICSQIQGKESLVDSSTDPTLKKFEFLCNKKNQSFSVNKAAVSLFGQHFDQLDLLRTELVAISKTKPTASTIITGHSLGGCVAMLFAFWLLKSLHSSKSKCLLCITFGSPLLGDEQLQQCVSKFSTWNYCFLHVVSNKDPTPKFFQPPGLSGVYKPLGTFLLCSDSGCACSEDPDFILEQLVASNSQSPQNQGPGYGQILEALKLGAICNNSFKFEGKLDPLQTSIETQLLAIGVLLPQQEPSMEIKLLLKQMTSKYEWKVKYQKKKVSDSDKKLNEIKMNMAKLEWYKKDARKKNIGYYDMYRKHENISDINVNGYKKKLLNYWEDSVAEVEDAPRMEGAHFQVRWLYGGTNYRRMIEPLHIAEYYKDGGRDYITGGKRPKQFILLEQWLMKKQEEEKKKKEMKKQEEAKKKKQEEEKKRKLFEQKQEMEKPRASPTNKKREMMAASLTEDSCFWAHVEEAIILCNQLKNGEPTTDAEKVSYEGKLKEFEIYVWNAIENYAVSSEIFLKGSSFMRWWKDYEGVNADPSGSLLGRFMVAGTYMKYGVEDLVVMEEVSPDFKNDYGQIGLNLKMKEWKTGENSNMRNQFSSGLELANFVVTSDPVYQAWAAIEEQNEINPNAEPSLYNEILKSNPTIIAFGTPRGCLQGKQGLISSSSLKEEDFSHFEFLCNKSNTQFSINESAIRIFRSNYDELDLLKTKLVQMSNRSSSIIITGRSMGGCVAILFTLWLLDSFNLSKTRQPLCITFGSPLLGDECLRLCVSEFSTWKSCFLHIVSNEDPIPKNFLSQNPSGTYMPFGTFLLCSASGYAGFEEPGFILKWLGTATSQSSASQDPDLGQQFFDYGIFLEDLEVTALYEDRIPDLESEINPLQASIIKQLQAIGVPLTQKESHSETNSVIKRMEKYEQLVFQKNNVSNYFEKLSDMKIHMARLECHKKEAKRKNVGQYDMYKKQPNTSDMDVHEDKKNLMSYWEVSVAEEEWKPHTEGDFFWTSWLPAGTSYRRMVEPLHIAEFYMKNGAKNYITDGRPRHFILLEKWWKERDEKPEASQKNAWIKRQVAIARLNEDSCFWAHVEEAIISCNLLDNCKNSNIQDTEFSKLMKEFEGYVYNAIINNEVSLDIFLEGSSFRQWWKKYEAIKGSLYCSELMKKFWEGMGPRSSPSS